MSTSLNYTMIPTPSSHGTPPWLQASEPAQTCFGSFWQTEHVHEQLDNLQETLDLLRSVRAELEQILLMKRSSQDNSEGHDSSAANRVCEASSLNHCSTDNGFQHSGSGMYLKFHKTINMKRISFADQESLSLEAARELFLALNNQLAPFGLITNQNSPWEERSFAVRLAQKLQKSRRNKLWKKKKRKHVAELLHKESELYDKADQDADEWRAREIANDIARHKMESMKEIAKVKAKEEKKKLESELELVLVVEKLQELRAMRIQKLKKQGHFLPEEDDKFLERVRAAVEEEERQAAAAADTAAAKDAIATAEVSRKAIPYTGTESHIIKHNGGDAESNQRLSMESERLPSMEAGTEAEEPKVERHGSGVGYDTLLNLPSEFYHYYHGSSNDMGTLIEVRRVWDAYIRPGGSRIPGHWVQPPPPSDEVWASYLVRPK